MIRDSRPYQICTRCLMDTSDPWISFDEHGRCNHCTDFLNNRICVANQDASDDSQILELVEHIKRKAKKLKYDCIIGLSGGVDSSYTAYLAVKYGLRVLGVHLDNGWDSPIAVKNISNIIKNLGIDYVTHVLPWNEFRQIQLAFLEASVPEAETPTDIAIAKSIHLYAEKENVPFILSGGNISSEGILPISWHYNGRDTKYAYSILKNTGYKKSLYRSVNYGFFREVYCLFIKKIKTYHFLNYVNYNKNNARLLLAEELGWEDYHTKHGESRYTKFIQSYYLFVKHGIDYRRATYSSELLFGLVDRDHALKLLSYLPYDIEEIDQEINYISKKLGVTKEYMEEVINRPPKWYVDYDNNMKLLGLMYDTYRCLSGKHKTSNF